MIRPGKTPSLGDVVARRHIAQWRRITARLVVLMNADSAAPVLVNEAHMLRRQCERLAAELGHLAEAAGQRRRGQALPP